MVIDARLPQEIRQLLKLTEQGAKDIRRLLKPDERKATDIGHFLKLDEQKAKDIRGRGKPDAKEIEDIHHFLKLLEQTTSRKRIAQAVDNFVSHRHRRHRTSTFKITGHELPLTTIPP